MLLLLLLGALGCQGLLRGVPADGGTAAAGHGIVDSSRDLGRPNQGWDSAAGLLWGRCCPLLLLRSTFPSTQCLLLSTQGVERAVGFACSRAPAAAAASAVLLLLLLLLQLLLGRLPLLCVEVADPGRAHSSSSTESPFWCFAPARGVVLLAAWGG